MKSLNEITTIIAEKMGREQDIAFRQILAGRVKVWRSRLIANALQKNPLQRKFFKQTLYIPMSAELKIPCDVLVNCEVAFTQTELPGLIREGRTMFDYIGGVDGKSPFEEATAGTQNYTDTGRFSSLFPKYEKINNRIAVSKKDLPMLRMDGIFDDPLVVMECNCACGMGTDCDTWNAPFPVSGEILQLIIQSIETIDYRAQEESKPTEDK